MLVKFFQRIIAILLIFVIAGAEFALIGKSAVSYAVDAVETSNKNVEFLAYFQKENGETGTSIDSAINSTELKLVIEVTVKNDKSLGGYFDGNINLNNANFKYVLK